MTLPTGSAERRAGVCFRGVWARRRGPLDDPFDVELERVAAVVEPADARFSLRLPGRDLGRFPSTPPSSVIAGSLE
jgi:hypothetical protein